MNTERKELAAYIAWTLFTVTGVLFCLYMIGTTMELWYFQPFPGGFLLSVFVLSYVATTVLPKPANTE
jgi:hypothetical protein